MSNGLAAAEAWWGGWGSNQGTCETVGDQVTVHAGSVGHHEMGDVVGAAVMVLHDREVQLGRISFEDDEPGQALATGGCRGPWRNR